MRKKIDCGKKAQMFTFGFDEGKGKVGPAIN
jgi:hypothetical protein